MERILNLSTHFLSTKAIFDIFYIIFAFDVDFFG